MSGSSRLATATVLLAIATSGAARASACDPPRYQILGQVVDAGDRPVHDALVRLLLDRVSAEEFARQGPRAQLRRTNASGTYVGLIDCGAADGVTDAPDPCARKPKYLTVMVEAGGHRPKLVVFKLKDLDVNRDAGGCLVQVPDIRLSR